MRYRARFGRWGEACVARALEDRDYTVMTSNGLNLTPYRDMIATKLDKGYDVQVKSTCPRTSTSVYQLDWHVVKKYLHLEETERQLTKRKLVLAVVNPRNGYIYIYGAEYLKRITSDAEKGIGDHRSIPGRLHLQYHDGVCWNLLREEIAQGIQIAEDDSDSGTSSLEDLPE